MSHALSESDSLEGLRRLTDPDEQARLQSDAELLELFIESGSRQAIELLVRRHAPLVASVVRRIVSDSTTAEDAFQATFLVLLKSAKKIRKRPSLAAWLYGVAYRAACRARQQYFHSRMNRTGDEIDVNTYAENEDPLLALARQLELETLDQELQLLPSALRDPLIEHYLLGHTAPEIAERMELSLSAVEGRLRRGRRALRLKLSRRGVSLSVVLAGTTWLQREAQAAQMGDWVQDSADQILNGPSIEAMNSRGIESIANANILSYVQGELAMRSTTYFKTASYIAASLGLAGAIGLTAWAIGQPGQGGQGTLNGPGVSSADATESDIGDEGRTLRLELAANPVLNQQAATGGGFSGGPTGSGFSIGGGAGAAQAIPAPSAIVPTEAAVVQKWKRPDGVPPPKWMQRSKEEFDEVDAIETMRDKLSQRIKVDYRNVSLSRVIEDLSERLNIPMIINDNALEGLGITREEQITLVNVPELTLRSVFQLILGPLELSHAIDNEVIRITDKDGASSQLVRYYNLSYVLPSNAYVDELIKVIKATVHASWDDDGGRDKVMDFGTTLIASCPEEVHHEIEKMLYKISLTNPESLMVAPKREKPQSTTTSGGGMGGTASVATGTAGGMGGMGGGMGMGGMGGGMGGVAGGGMF